MILVDFRKYLRFISHALCTTTSMKLRYDISPPAIFHPCYTPLHFFTFFLPIPHCIEKEFTMKTHSTHIFFSCIIAFFLLFDQGMQVQEAKFVGSKNSDKYHYKTCAWAKKISSSNLVTFKKVTEAKKVGYRACRVCKPPEKDEGGT